MISCIAFLFIHQQHYLAFGTFVPWLGTEPASPAMEGQSLSHWTTGKSLLRCILSCNLSPFTLATLQGLDRDCGQWVSHRTLQVQLFSVSFLFYFIWPCPLTFGILVPRAGTEPRPRAVSALRVLSTGLPGDSSMSP